MNRRDNEGIVRNRSKVSGHVRREFLRAHSQRETGRFMLQRLLLLSLTLLLAVVAFPREGMADYTREEIAAIEKRLSARSAEIRGNTPYDTLCGTCTGVQLQRAGVFKSMVSSDGNGAYNLYTRPTGSTPSKHTRTFFPAARKGGNWTITSILNELNNGNTDGRETLAVFCWNTGTGAKGKAAGHVLLVHAVFNGKVYFGESWGTKVRCCTIAQFASDYAYRPNSGEYIFDGAIGYGVEDILNPLSKMTPMGTANNGYYKIARDDGHLKEWPYASATTLETKNVNVAAEALTADDILYVELTVKNTADNIWAKLRTSNNSVRYAFLGNLELQYRKKSDACYRGYITLFSSTSVLPISGAKSLNYYQAGKAGAEFEGTYQDATGVLWYKLKGKEEYIETWKVIGAVPLPPTVTFEGSYPGNASRATGYPEGQLTPGKPFGLRGTVKCAEEILTTVTGRIVNANNNDIIASVTVEPGTNSYNVQNTVGGKCINSLSFGSYPVGAYRYEIVASTASGHVVMVHTSSFTIGNATAPVNIPVQSLDISMGGYRLNRGEYPMDYDDQSLGEVINIGAIVYPETATQQLNWNSSNPSVVSVARDPYSPDGWDACLTLQGYGEAQITCTAQGSSVSSNFTITVTCRHPNTAWVITRQPTGTASGEETRRCLECGASLDVRSIPPLYVPVQQISAWPEGLMFYEGYDQEPGYWHMERYTTAQISTSVSPEDASCTAMIYTSSDSSVAAVNEGGLITAGHTGICTITVSSADGSNVSTSFTLQVALSREYTMGYNYSTGDWQDEIWIPFEQLTNDRFTYAELNLNKPVYMDEEANSSRDFILYTRGASLAYLYVKEINYNTGAEQTIYSNAQPAPGELQTVIRMKTNTQDVHYRILFNWAEGETGGLTLGIKPTDVYQSLNPESIWDSLDGYLYRYNPKEQFHILYPSSENGTYRRVFCSFSLNSDTLDLDLKATITDIFGNVIAEDDDSGEGNHFRLAPVLEKNHVYILTVEPYDPASLINEFNVFHLSGLNYSQINGFDCDTQCQLRVGEKKKINWSVPDLPSIPDMVFDMTESEVCSVSPDGTVRGIAPGTETIYVWPVDAPEMVREITVTVLEAPEVLSHAEYMQAEEDTTVCVDTYVQATQSWFDNKINVYAQSQDGAHFIYQMNCTEDDAKQLTAGTPIRVTGRKTVWAGEVEITDATFIILDKDPFIPGAEDVTYHLYAETEELIHSQNKFVAFKGMTVEQYGDTGAAFAYKDTQNKTDDLYFMASKNGQTYTFCVEYYLCGPNTEVYKAVEALKIGDVIDLEGFLYWYNGPYPHITSVKACPQDGMCGEQLIWAYENGTLTISGSGEMFDYTWGNVPWQGYLNSITNITVNSGITSIGAVAFANMPNLISISLPDGLLCIGNSAFCLCPELHTIQLPDSLTTIGETAFSTSGLTEVLIPGNVQSIGGSAFFSIPASAIQVSEENGYYTSVDGVLFSTDMKRLVVCPTGKTGVYNIPNGVEGICTNAFFNCDGISEIVIPGTVQDIGEMAFYDCGGLSKILIPDSVTQIPSMILGANGETGSADDYGTVTIYCHADSAALRYAVEHGIPYEIILKSPLDDPDFVIPAAVTEIGEEAFSGIKAKRIKLPENTESIGSKAFANCTELEAIYIPAGCEIIKSDAFSGVTNLTIFGTDGSYAQFYAQSRGLVFVIVE